MTLDNLQETKDKNSQTTIVEQGNKKRNGKTIWLVEVEKEKAFVGHLERNEIIEKHDDYIRKNNNKANTVCYYFYEITQLDLGGSLVFESELELLLDRE
jgi:hypothetical protein